MKKLNYKKRKYIIGNKRRFFTFICTSIVLALIIINTLTVNAEKATGYKTICVKSGDTIWSIAMTHTDNDDIRKVVYEIQKANSIEEGVIKVGQRIKVPNYE